MGRTDKNTGIFNNTVSLPDGTMVAVGTDFRIMRTADGLIWAKVEEAELPEVVRQIALVEALEAARFPSVEEREAERLDAARRQLSGRQLLAILSALPDEVLDLPLETEGDDSYGAGGGAKVVTANGAKVLLITRVGGYWSSREPE